MKSFGNKNIYSFHGKDWYMVGIWNEMRQGRYCPAPDICEFRVRVPQKYPNILDTFIWSHHSTRGSSKTKGKNIFKTFIPFICLFVWGGVTVTGAQGLLLAALHLGIPTCGAQGSAID